MKIRYNYLNLDEEYYVGYRLVVKNKNLLDIKIAN